MRETVGNEYAENATTMGNEEPETVGNEDIILQKSEDAYNQRARVPLVGTSGKGWSPNRPP
jgi:hypothetical protein